MRPLSLGDISPEAVRHVPTREETAPPAQDRTGRRPARDHRAASLAGLSGATILPAAQSSSRRTASGSASSPPAHTIVLSRLGEPFLVPYRLRRSARARRLGLRINAQGLEVVLPQHSRLGEAEITKAIREHETWIIAKLAVWQQRAAAREAHRPRYTDGGEIPLLGQKLTLRTQPHSDHRRSLVQQMGTELWVSGPAARDDALLKAAVQAWLKKQARPLFLERMQPYVARLGRAPSSVSLNSARTRWGSCSRDGSIRLNWRLIQYDTPLIDYVIAHELAHLVELNHSPRFWAQLKALMPDYQTHQKRLSNAPDVLIED